MSTFKRSTVHVLKKNLNLTGSIEQVVTLDDVEVVNATQDLDLTTDLAEDVFIMGSVDDLEGEEGGGGAMVNLVDGATGAAADSVEAIEFAEVEGLVFGGGGRRKRERNGYLRLVVVGLR
ncbi:hypothetical protein R6Q59_036271 [Mikania micrantha]